MMRDDRRSIIDGKRGEDITRENECVGKMTKDRESILAEEVRRSIGARGGGREGGKGRGQGTLVQ